MMGGQNMDLEDKLELCKGYRAIKLMARLDSNEDLLNLLMEMEFEKLLKMGEKYSFFKGLNKQTKLDNVISMMKIFESLEVELPNIKINTMDIDKTCDELWESINEQIPVSDNDYNKLISLMKNIVNDDDINHPNTKRKLMGVLRNLNEIEDYDCISYFIENHNFDWEDIRIEPNHRDWRSIRYAPNNNEYGHYRILRDR